VTADGRRSRSILPWLALAAAVLGLYLFRSLLLPFFLAAVAAYFLNPAITWAQGQAIRRDVAVMGLFVLVGVLLFVIFETFGPRLVREARAFLNGLPKTVADAGVLVESARAEAVKSFPILERVLPAVGKGWTNPGFGGGNVELLARAGGAVFVLVLAPFFAFFILRDSQRLTGALMDRIPPRHIETSVAVWCEIDRIIGSYLRGLALDGLAVGVTTTLGLWAAGIPYPMLLGALTGFANVLPMAGLVVGAVSSVFVCLTQGLGMKGAGLALLVIAGVKLLDDIVLQPLTIGKSVHQHPLLVVASIIAGGQALGIVGMFLAVPVVTAIQEAARILLERRRVLTGVALPAEAERAPDYVC
jgi:predicted PurR-regulated permease PerM